jgi:glycopeptide antibiotics resistance protein
MRFYVQPIMTAAWVFPFVAVLITFPYMVFQYRRYGSILLLRTTILYSFILYMMCAYFLTMLPLPSRADVAKLTTPYLQLTPFQDVVTWLQKSGAVLSRPSTWTRLINRSLFVMVANIVMMVPLGIYLRYYFRCSLRKTILISLGISLVFELTQLSALFGIYPRPYRLCETDDLITNTLGGLIGYAVAGPLTRFLPSRERIDEVAYRRGMHVSVTRRVTAALVDWVILGFAAILLLFFTKFNRVFTSVQGYAQLLLVFTAGYAALVLCYFVLGEWLFRGTTPGKSLTHIRLVDSRTGGRPKLWQCLVRYSLVYFAFVPLPFIALVALVLAFRSDVVQWEWLGLCALLVLVYITCLVWIIVSVLNRDSRLPHGALSKTDDISTLKPPEEPRSIQAVARVAKRLPWKENSSASTEKPDARTSRRRRADRQQSIR